MLTLDVNSNRGVFKLNLPTSLNEIDESYIMEVTNHVKVDSNYTLIGVVFREKLSTLILAARKNKKNSDIPVIPVFVKAGKPGWASLIPFYNTYCLYDIAWGNGWLFLLTFVPCVGAIFGIIMLFKLAKAFGQGTGFGFGLLFLNTIFILILGFGKSEYVGPQ